MPPLHFERLGIHDEDEVHVANAHEQIAGGEALETIGIACR